MRKLLLFAAVYSIQWIAMIDDLQLAEGVVSQRV